MKEKKLIRGISGFIDSHLADFLLKKNVKRIITEVEPENIYHLAAQSTPTVSYIKPRYTQLLERN